MNRLLLALMVLIAGAIASGSVIARDGNNDDSRENMPITIAVLGDWPYNTLLLNNASLLINSVNSDPDVSLLIHIGDIHSGSQPCTSAGTLPPISTSNPGWNQRIFSLFQQFNVPVIYTPGDNEWTDCHKSKQFSSGYPLKELASVRSLFFSKPGHSLGLEEKEVWSQAQHYDPAYPTDAQFVENVIWKEAKVVFVTLNVPGSNNDTLPWSGIFSDPAAQDKEVAERSAANLRWLHSAFEMAEDVHARAMVIGLQADMWDPAAVAAGELTNYTPFVNQLAELALEFRRPVLLLNGDSHVYGYDQPLADPSSTTGVIHGTPAVGNLTRITVQGSTTAPAEWLRLSIDPRKPEVFSWVNVPYCKDPSTSCQ